MHAEDAHTEAHRRGTEEVSGLPPLGRGRRGGGEQGEGGEGQLGGQAGHGGSSERGTARTNLISAPRASPAISTVASASHNILTHIFRIYNLGFNLDPIHLLALEPGAS